MSVYRAEYIWIDGSLPTSKLRSKTKVIKSGEEPPIWGLMVLVLIKHLG
ncbi:MAG: hypothetical protein CM1200mP7_1570 [Chloroflexota bacterium]|nr:MAG: hypothetical protein CM1200mP7_1570 [Chloroflexota bacterium]